MGTRINNLPTAEALTDDMYIAVDGTDGTYKTLLKNIMGKGGSRDAQMSISNIETVSNIINSSGEVN